MDLSRYLAIVPARTGSKRLPEKNFRDFCGKPLWKWALECAHEAGLKNVAVSCDVPKRLGDSFEDEGMLFLGSWEETPNSLDRIVCRPSFLAIDESSVWEVVEHVCYTMEHFGPVVLLQPTSPLRTADHVRECVRRFELYPEHREFVTASCWGEEPNGAVYVAAWKAWRNWPKFHGVSMRCGSDIDTREDWDLAEAAMRERLDASAPKEAGPWREEKGA